MIYWWLAISLASARFSTPAVEARLSSAHTLDSLLIE
jgi:hypothetical protein